MKTSVYVAGPLGFSEAGRFFHTTVLLPMLSEMGYEPLDPWTLTDPELIEEVKRIPLGPEQRDKWSSLNQVIGRNNGDAIKRCQLVVAVLDGSDVDSGTAAEIGYAAALGKPVIGYRGDFRLSAENIGGTVNLQVEYFIGASGGKIVRTTEELRAVLALRQKQGKPVIPAI